MEKGSQMQVTRPVKGTRYGREYTWREPVCMVEVIAAEPQRIEEIGFAGAKAEGYPSPETFVEDWFLAFPRTKECWCMTWRIIEDVYIPSREGHGNEHNYTRHYGNALEQEGGEGVNPGEIPRLDATRAAAKRRQREAGEAQAKWLALPPEERLRQLREMAEFAGVDLTRQIASIDRRIESARAKVERLARNPSERAA